MGRNPGAISFSAVIRGGERAERNAYRNGHSHPAIEHGHALPGRPAGLRDSSPSRSGPRGATVMLRGLRPVLYGYSPSMRWWGSSARAGRTRHRPHYTRTQPPRSYPGCGETPHTAKRKKTGRHPCTIRLSFKNLGETPHDTERPYGESPAINPQEPSKK